MTSCSVIIVTINRPECVRRCLKCLLAENPAPEQVSVVDASSDDRTRAIVEAFEGVNYLRNEMGPGHMTASRNIGLAQATGELIAFIDDDAYVHPGWSAAVRASFDAPDIGAVAGRALNNQPGEEREGLEAIGRLLPDGRLTGHFAADPGQRLEVDHLIGCNMIIRREVLAQLGGFRDVYPGTELREEADLALRIRRLGYRIVFNPQACVDHVGATYTKGRRFDLRYAYYAQRNHLTLLLLNFGPTRAIFWRYLGRSTLEATTELVRKIGGAVVRCGVFVAGTTAGLVAGLAARRRFGDDPVRRDARGAALSGQLDTRDSDDGREPSSAVMLSADRPTGSGS